MNKEEILEDVKRHLDYVNTTKQKSIRDTEMEVMYQEIDRLQNIINELEKYIKKNTWYYPTSDGCQWLDQFKVLDKLKELKEGNK